MMREGATPRPRTCSNSTWHGDSHSEELPSCSPALRVQDPRREGQSSTEPLLCTWHSAGHILCYLSFQTTLRNIELTPFRDKETEAQVKWLGQRGL